jgi:putative ABC transport system permease protein
MFDSSDTEKLVKDIELLDSSLTIGDLEKSFQAERAMVLVISIFLYGFIGVITLIGVTNIFNTITSNMELRQKEFAMLKSIGMTKKEFNRMINLETLFYSAKSLCYGIALGLIGSYIIHFAFSKSVERAFALPLTAIIISIIFVFIIVYIIMKYSINKINKQNTIETIRNENI